MALSNKKDPASLREGLTGWLAERLPDASDVTVEDVRSPGESGFSAETVFFTARWSDAAGDHERDLVARFSPAGPQLFPEYDLIGQYRLLEALHEHADVPVPPTVWLEESSELFGSPFYVMDRVDGRVPVDTPNYLGEGWVLELSADERRRMFVAGLDVLAKIHAVDWRSLGLDDLGRPQFGDTPLTQMLRYFADYYEFARLDNRPHPTIDAAFEWVRGNVPAEEPQVVLNWGDSRPGNMIFADDHSVAAVLDWELAFLGSRELDLGWWMFMQRAFSEGYGLTLPEGIPGAEETVEVYRRLSGYEPQHVEWHVRFAGLRATLMMTRYVTVMVQVGAVPEDTTLMHDNPIVQTLAKVMGFDWTVGDVNALQLNRQAG